MDTSSEITSIVQRVVSTRVQHFGVKPSVANDAAKAILEDLQKEIGGETFYWPMRNTNRAAILAEFTGDNHHQLCRKHGISCRTLRRWIKEENEK